MGPPARGGGPQFGASTTTKGTRISHCETASHHAEHRAQGRLSEPPSHCGMDTTLWYSNNAAT